MKLQYAFPPLDSFSHLLPTSAVGGVPWSQRAHLLVLHSAGQWAELTLRAPASAHVAAALGLGHAVPAGGRLLAHGLQDLGVAVALPVVWRQEGRSEGELNHVPAPSPSPLVVPPAQRVLTDTFGSGGARLEAVVALAAVAAHRVDAAAVLADAGFGAALVQIWRRKQLEVLVLY